MDGTVLHFDPGGESGLIRGSDGERYAFARADWRSEGVPGPGDRVDFEIVEGRAAEVFRVAHAAAAPAPARPREDVAAWVKRRPAMVMAVLVLAGCLLPFLSVPFFTMTLFSLPSTASFFVSFAGAFGDGGAPGMAGIRAAVWSLYLLYVIPAAAAWLIFREVTAAASRPTSLAVGIAGLLTPVVTAVVSTAIARASVPRAPPGAKADIPSPPDAVLQLLSFIGIGWMLIIVASIGLVAIGCGWTPFGEAGRRSDD